jgi:hypothetical protein
VRGSAQDSIVYRDDTCISAQDSIVYRDDRNMDRQNSRMAVRNVNVESLGDRYGS